MSKSIDQVLRLMSSNPGNIRYDDLCKVCDCYFGECRQRGTSHRVYKTPWKGDPRVNIQKAKGGKAKAYQVKQVMKAIDKLTSEKNYL